MTAIKTILSERNFSKENLIFLLESRDNERLELFKAAAKIKEEETKNKVFLRGLIEFSNICSKDCYYCGIRKSNGKVNRYTVTEAEVIEAFRYAHSKQFGSVVLQSGEIAHPAFTRTITHLLEKTKKLSAGKLGITLSCGEQSKETYRQWFKAGAHRYLLRIEASSPELYKKLHPDDSLHSFEKRKQALYSLKETSYQVGTGVMVGLPWQTTGHLANDLLFMKELDIDMCGMGPYIEHEDTPLFKYREKLIAPEQRFDLTLKMIAILRLMMEDINIAATTAMQAIDKQGREKALMVGANILMPNITPRQYREDYFLYENKPCYDENPDDCLPCLEARVAAAGSKIVYGEWGDSKHFAKKQNSKSN